MTLVKTTLIPAQTQMFFIKKEFIADKDQLILYFQSYEYIHQYRKLLSPEEVLTDLDRDYILSENFTPNIKFKLTKQEVARLSFVNQLQPLTKYAVDYAFSPQAFMSQPNSALAYVTLKLIHAETLEGSIQFTNPLLPDFSVAS